MTEYIPLCNKKDVCYLVDKIFGTSNIFVNNETITLSQITDINTKLSNLIGGVMVSVLVSSGVDRGLEHRWDQTKDYEIDICFFSAALMRKSKE